MKLAILGKNDRCLFASYVPDFLDDQVIETEQVLKIPNYIEPVGYRLNRETGEWFDFVSYYGGEAIPGPDPESVPKPDLNRE